MRRDLFSGLKTFQALPPQDLDGTALAGTTVDTQGFDRVLLVVNMGQWTGGGDLSADNRHTVALQHASQSAAGVDTWQAVPSIYMLRSETGAVTSGIFLSMASAADNSEVAHKIGYLGPLRNVRLHFSGVGVPSVMSASALAILGDPQAWPVTEPGATEI